MTELYIDPDSSNVFDLNRVDQSALSAFLESPAVPQHSMNFYQLDGYLRALACAPVASLPISSWFPLIFHDELPTYASSEEELSIRDNILSLYAFHQHQVAESLCNLPCESIYASLREARINLEQWARGYLQGYIVMEASWNGSLARAATGQTEQNLDGEPFFDELDAIIYIVSTVADAEYALEQGTSVEDLKEVFERLPKSIILCGYIGRILHEHDLALEAKAASTPSDEYQPEHFASGCLVTELVPKDGLADEGEKNLCPCGSGKNFKSCCLH